MKTYFVLTVGDVIALSLLALSGLFFLYVYVVIKIDEFKQKKKKKS